MSQLKLQGLTVVYRRSGEEVVALDGFSLDVNPGDFVVLLGPSGCGKSTVLNAVAGTVAPDQGSITIGDRTVYDAAPPRTNLPPNRRHLGMVFQSYSLWPHMSVVRNVEFPLKARGQDRSQRSRSARAALAKVRCGDLVDRYPGELSGGQQQRVALARAIVAESDVLLFDEPLSNLDTLLRQELRDEIHALHARLQFTGVYVTHDKAEALSLATTIVVMRAGRIEQVGSPSEVYSNPVSPYVARFMGGNLLEGQVALAGNDATFLSPLGGLPVPESSLAGPAIASFYPHECSLEAASGAPGTIALRKFVGSHWEYRVEAQGSVVDIAQTDELPVGAHVELRIEPGTIRTFPVAGAGGRQEAVPTGTGASVEDL